MHLFPAIDLRDGRVVRLLKGEYDQETRYAQDPVEQARAFESAGCTWLHVVDLDGARTGRMTQHDLIARMCRETRLKVEVGGGVRDERAIDSLLERGVERVILGTAALTRWDWFESLVTQDAYRDRIVLGLDARNGQLAVSGWEQQTEATALEIARRVTDWPLAAIVYTDIATDGTLEGPNVEATRQIAQATRVPVVASGGVGTLDHLRALAALPIQGAIVGRAIYENRFAVARAVQVLEGVGPDGSR